MQKQETVQERQARYRRERAKQGLCHSCGRNPKRPGKTKCQECSDMQRRYSGHQPRQSHEQTEGFQRTARYRQMFEVQKGCCAICGKPREAVSRAFAEDHDHKTGKVRGLLCAQCNLGLGYFKDSIITLASAIAYLQRTAKGFDV